MHKIFLAVSSMIVTHFLQKAYRKVHEQPETKEEVYRRMKAEHERRRAEPKVNVRFESTPRSPDAWMASIGTVGEFAAQYKENIPPPKEPCDHAALRPCSDLGLRAWGGDCNGSAMGVAR